MSVIPALAVPDAELATAYVIFLASYLVFSIGKFPGLKVDRPGAAIIGAVAMIAFRIVPARDALRFIDFSTVVLLFSMMLIVGNLHLVGFFEWNAEHVLRRLKPGYLLPAVIFTCGLLSAFFVNIHARSDDRRTPIGGRQAHRREARHPTITLRKVSAAMFEALRDER